MLSKQNIPDLNWLKTYTALGMRDEFLSFSNSEKFVGNKSGCWKVSSIKGATENKVVEALRSNNVSVELYGNDLDQSVIENDRHPTKDGSYVVYFTANVEADENLKNLSANQLKSAETKGITLLERLLLELAYFLTTGKHLDENSVTLCSGSRCSGGRVPFVRWYSDNLWICVFWCYLGRRFDGLRSRAVVS